MFPAIFNVFQAEVIEYYIKIKMLKGKTKYREFRELREFEVFFFSSISRDIKFENKKLNRLHHDHRVLIVPISRRPRVHGRILHFRRYHRRLLHHGNSNFKINISAFYRLLGCDLGVFLGFC